MVLTDKEITKSFRWRTAITMWLCASSFYGYQYILRVAPGVMVHDLMQEFSVNATIIGALAALYMYVYSFLQIPIGLCTDVFGPRRTIFYSLLLCLTGTLLFTFTDHLSLAYLSRALTGAGSAVGFIGASSIIRRWFPAKHVGIMLALTMWMATIGAVGGGVPFSILMEVYNWRSALLILAGLGAALALLIWSVLRDSPKQSKPLSQDSPQEVVTHNYWLNLKTVAKTPVIWLVGACAFGLFLPISVLGDLWGVSYIMSVYKVDRTSASFCTSIVFIGLCCGSVFFSWISKSIVAMSKSLIAGSIIIIFCLCALFYFPSDQFLLGCVIIFFIGFAVGSEILCFTIGCNLLPVNMTGVTVGVINTILMSANAGMQFVISALLDYFRQDSIPVMVEGVEAECASYYSCDCLSSALKILILAGFFSLLCSIILTYITSRPKFVKSIS